MADPAVPDLPCRPHPHPATRRTRSASLLVIAVALLAAGGAAALANRPHRAGADTIHVAGHHARVLGVKNWYGSYDMGSLGIGWCIDPQVDHPPDPALGYAPDPVAETDDDIRTAMAWAAGRNGGSDAASTAAVTLVLHDLLARPYGGVPLNVDGLDASSLTEFGGDEAVVARRAQEIKADALAHRHLRGPFRMSLEATPVAPGAPGELTLTLTDAWGHGVAGVPVLVDSTGATLGSLGIVGTDAAGVAHVGFTAAEGANTFRALTAVPDTTLAAFGPTLGPGQRVVVPRLARADATTAFDAVVPPGEIEVDKRGDVEPYLPVTGAVFEIRPTATPDAEPPAATLRTDAAGRTPTAALAPGRYRVTERTPPPGYTTAPAQEVELVSGERVTVVVVDTARRGSLRLRKEDGVTHDLLPGARFELRYDADRDGEPERLLRELTTGDVATVVGELAPGDYALVELAAAPGYEVLAAPVRFTIRPGETTELTVANQPRSTLEFAKRPDPDQPDPDQPDQPDPDQPRGRGDDEPSFAGAVFAVRGPVPDGADPGDEPEVGRCTTGAEGRCSLPPRTLVPGARYCWEEIEAPPGWGVAEPGCVVAPAAGRTLTVTVDEPRPTPPTTTSTTPPTTAPPTTAPPTTPPTSGPPDTVPPPAPSGPARPAHPLLSPPTTAPPSPSLPRTGSEVLPEILLSLAITTVGGLVTRESARRKAQIEAARSQQDVV